MAAIPDRLRAGKPAWRQQAEAFWSWWTAQLAREVPESLGGAGMKRAPVVALRGETLVLLEARGTTFAEIGEAPLSSLDPEGRKIALRSLLARAGETDPRVRLCLDRDESLLRRVALPLATEENLAQVLAFEMDRLTPFRGEDVYFDHRVASRDPVAARIQVDLGVARRPLVDAKVATLREYGGEVQAVVLADDVARWSAPLDLLPEGLPGELDRRRERSLQMTAGGIVLALLALALALPLWQKREAVIALQPVLMKARAEAEATDILSKELEKIVADYNFLLTKKHTVQPTLVLVEELSRLLPDTTWVQQLDIRPTGKIREVQISGETPSSSKLIEIFEQSKVLQNAAPRGSITKGSQPGNERFLIAAEVRPRTMPEAVPLSMAASFPTATVVPPPPPPPVDAAKPAAADAAKPATADATKSTASDATKPAPADAQPPATATVTPTPAVPPKAAAPNAAAPSAPAPNAPADFGPARRSSKAPAKGEPKPEPGK
ncbi:hypothetical protein DSM104443_03801 [Usitatibacter rugosus]|uniref:General secretion pathway protein L n=1 Tax=Usitatibacter rugosus TaxID=2732067 RepID=A0A6M4H0N1_9PROT|nr:PilN domain-containing protein [Usitatibacter rugosus]QJR12708.1 hypothetical protein DSM104443_03801 [Usitatibacter rugosus]